MQPEAEALILALEAVKQARSGEEAERLEAVFQARIDDVLACWPHVSRERLVRFAVLAHSRWARAQERQYPSLPPRA
jgi:hypothetical protein